MADRAQGGTMKKLPVSGSGACNDTPYYKEPRVDPGGNALNPPRTNWQPKIATLPPKGPDLTGIKGLPTGWNG